MLRISFRFRPRPKADIVETFAGLSNDRLHFVCLFVSVGIFAATHPNGAAVRSITEYLGGMIPTDGKVHRGCQHPIITRRIENVRFVRVLSLEPLKTGLEIPTTGHFFSFLRFPIRFFVWNISLFVVADCMTPPQTEIVH